MTDDTKPNVRRTAKTEDTTESASVGATSPAQEAMDANTAREQAHIEANQRRYDLRTSGKTSEEVNEMERKAAAKR